MHHWDIPAIHNIGYGQLSLSGTPLGLATQQNAAGVWAVLGSQNDVDQSKNSGLDITAAVVAKSFLGSDAVNAQSVNGRGVYGHSSAQQGVVGESDSNEGLTGITHNKAVAAVSAHNPGGRAGFFDGDVKVTGQVMAETLTASVDIVLGADCAEEFDLAPSEAGEPGTVMVIDEAQCLTACSVAYDQRVTGVIAGAGDYSPGLILDRRVSKYERRPIALLGKVYCKVDAAHGPIQVGDLLTTSPNPGHAMKASDRSRAFGATIGKALRSFPAGTGLIPILVSTR